MSVDVRLIAATLVVLAAGCSANGKGEREVPRPPVLDVAILESGELRFEAFRVETGRLVRKQGPLGQPTAFSRAGAEPDRQDITWEEVYLREADGSERRLTRDRRADLAPQLLMDGRVAFISCAFPQGGALPECELDSIDPRSGERATMLDDLGVAFHGELSPDESRFLFTRLDKSGAPAGLFVRDLKTGKEQRVVDGSSGAWSPDGLSIAFVSDRDDNGRCLFHDCVGYAGEIYISDADGGFERRLTINSEVDAAPEWSGDSEWIVFARIADENDDWDLHAVRADAMCEHQLTDTKAWEISATWLGSGHGGLSC